MREDNLDNTLELNKQTNYYLLMRYIFTINVDKAQNKHYAKS